MLSKNKLNFLKKKIKKLWVEILFFSFSLVISLAVFIIYFNEKKSEEKNIIEIESSLPKEVKKSILVDVSGAVEKPDVYQVTAGARLKDVLIVAGGLSAEADRMFFSRNFNLARFVSDQEKIYIPSIQEINSGLFSETSRLIDYVSPVETDKDIVQPETTKININQANLEELDQLPGIGKTTAQKIIQNRPYKTVEELLNKNIVKKNVYEQIKNLISL